MTDYPTLLQTDSLQDAIRSTCVETQLSSSALAAITTADTLISPRPLPLS